MSTATTACPAWCRNDHAGEAECSRDHASEYIAVELSLAEPVAYISGAGPDSLGIRLWQSVDAGAPAVNIVHMGAVHDEDGYLPDMTPAEARALARVLVRKAQLAEASAGADDGTGLPGCPDGIPWCIFGSPEYHLGESFGVPVAGHDGTCSYERAREAGILKDTDARSCDDGNDAELYLGEDQAVPVVTVHHGDDSLPPMDLDAAEAFGWHLIALAEAGRQPVLEVSR